MHWFVAGNQGQLGSALMSRLANQSVSGADLPELDLTDERSIERWLGTLPRPSICLNAAALTQVDRCEREPDDAQRANAEGPGLLARACSRDDVGLAHVSTDYVFAGDARRPYREDDPTGPRSVYGRTKLAGEQAVLAASNGFLVVRTSWLFGKGRNFIAAVLAQAAARRAGAASGPLRVVDDQTGRPTYAVDLAAAIVQLVSAGARGVVHVANAGMATWWDLARFALDEAGYRDVAIDRIATSELETDAPRPAWSVLDTARAEAFGVKMRSWQEAVSDYLRSDQSPLRNLPGSSAHA
jgi:dTDP-4-dehydrorhamnose reductase